LRRGSLSCQLTLLEAELVDAISSGEVQCGLERVIALGSEHITILHSFLQLISHRADLAKVCKISVAGKIATSRLIAPPHDPRTQVSLVPAHRPAKSWTLWHNPIPAKLLCTLQDITNSRALSLMSIAALISGLKDLANDVEHTIDAFCSSDTQPTKGEYAILTALSARFSKAAARFLDQINEIKEERARWTREEGRKLVSASESVAAELTEKGRPKSLATFKRNITLIFKGPQESDLDSAPEKSRHKLTRKRCEQIRYIKPNGVLVWAAAFPPSTWTAGFMTNATFNYMIAEIESKDIEIFPENMRKIVHTFGREAPLQDSENYSEFIRGKVSMKVRMNEELMDHQPLIGIFRQQSRINAGALKLNPRPFRQHIRVTRPLSTNPLPRNWSGWYRKRIEYLEFMVI
jgi:hypothetical protein